MPEIIFQRIDPAAYWESYPVYINREQQLRLAFAEEKSLNLAPGRYHISCGGLRGMEDELWLDLGSHRKVIQIDAHWCEPKMRKWPKNYQIRLQEVPPLRKASTEDRAQIRFLFRQSLGRAFAFASLLLLLAAYIFYLADREEDSLLAWLALIPVLLAPWVYHGSLLAHLKNRT